MVDEAVGGPADLGQEYELWFGPEYDWRAIVSKCFVDKEFELTMTHSDADWAVDGLDFNWSRAEKWFGFDFIIAVGPARTSIFGFPITAGPCTCGFCGAMWSLAKASPTTNASRSRMRAETCRRHVDTLDLVGEDGNVVPFGPSLDRFAKRFAAARNLIIADR